MKRVSYWLLLLVSIALIASSCADDSSSSSTDNTTSSSDDSSDNSTSTSDNSSSSSVTPIVFAGYSHTCALLDNTSVKCWGRNNTGQLGIDNTTDMGDDAGEMALIPTVNLGTGRTATAISAGNYHSCALLDNASVKCWGYNGQGQLGIDSAVNTGDNSSEMASLTGINLGAGRTATAITGGALHTCAILDNASVKCWGYNGYGQLGIDNTTNMGDGAGEMALLTGINLGTGRTATAISAGVYHTCAILDNASVKCWGWNNSGRLGIDNGSTMGEEAGDMAVLPSINLGTGRTATAISAGNSHTCALLDNASVKCWGRNNNGQLGIDNNTSMGDGAGEMALIPTVNLGTGRTATAISVGYQHSCAVLDNASIKCWGRNENGQLGIDNDTVMGDGAGEMAVLPSVSF